MPESTGRGVLVVMNEQILTASEAQKIHTESAGSFASPEFGPVGVLDAGKVLYVRRAIAARRRGRGAGADTGLRVARLETTVDLIKSAAGADDRFLRCSLAAGATGIVIEAMGRGNLPPAMKPGIEAASAAGVPVVLASRYGAGSVQERYGYDGRRARPRPARRDLRRPPERPQGADEADGRARLHARARRAEGDLRRDREVG